MNQKFSRTIYTHTIRTYQVITSEDGSASLEETGVELMYLNKPYSQDELTKLRHKMGKRGIISLLDIEKQVYEITMEKLVEYGVVIERPASQQ